MFCSLIVTSVLDYVVDVNQNIKDQINNIIKAAGKITDSLGSMVNATLISWSVRSRRC